MTIKRDYRIDPENPMTPLEVMESTGLDWEVKTAPMQYQTTPKAPPVLHPKYRVLYREDSGQILDGVKHPAWKPVQNASMFQYLEGFTKATKSQLVRAGETKEGRMVFAQVELPGEFEMIPGDKSKVNLTFLNPHKAGHRVSLMFTPIRLACTNMISYLVNSRNFGEYSITHLEDFKPGEAKIVMAAVRQYIADYSDSTQILAGKKYRKGKLNEYLKGVYLPRGFEMNPDKETKAEKRLAHAQNLVEDSPGCHYAPGSWWNAFNAVTFEVDHRTDMRSDRHEYYKQFGGGLHMKQSALEGALGYCQ